MSVVDEVELVRDRVARIRRVYPAARVVLLADGPSCDATLDWPSCDGIELRCGYQRLYAVESGGLVVQAHLEAFLSSPATWWLKVDPDTIVRRPVRELPEDACFFGTIQGGAPGPSLQGGCVGGTRQTAERLVRSGALLRPELADYPRTWARGNPNLLARGAAGLVSFDFVLAWACRRVGIPLRSHPEIRSEWKVPPMDVDRYAVTHPHKSLDENAERRAAEARAALAGEVRKLVAAAVPAGSSVSVISKGDERLVDLDRVAGRHFPTDGDGAFVGYHPADGPHAVAFLERERCLGVEFLVIPESARWWLDYYGEFARHLESSCELVGRKDGVGAIWRLAPSDVAEPIGAGA